MEGKEVYKFELDGVETYENYNTLEDAMIGAKVYFSANKNKEIARFYVLEIKDLNIMLRNKNFEGKNKEF